MSRYRLVGTGAALAQGVRLPYGDIDILVARRSDVDLFAVALAGFPCLTEPVWLSEAGQYYARFAVGGHRRRLQHRRAAGGDRHDRVHG
nr:hypothetical protein GCM10020092_068490 [Actinoplanes digitatis]